MNEFLKLKSDLYNESDCGMLLGSDYAILILPNNSTVEIEYFGDPPSATFGNDYVVKHGDILLHTDSKHVFNDVLNIIESDKYRI
mgnify:CR=1 FL=1